MKLAILAAFALAFGAVRPTQAQNPDVARVVIGPSGYYELWLNDHRLFLYGWDGRLHVATFSDRERSALIQALERPSR